MVRRKYCFANVSEYTFVYYKILLMLILLMQVFFGFFILFEKLWRGPFLTVTLEKKNTHFKVVSS